MADCECGDPRAHDGHCGCCGTPVNGGEWCARCKDHLGPDHLAPWDRTWYAMHDGDPCPFGGIELMPALGQRCPYCPDERAQLVDASAVYGPKYEGQFNMWQCPGCLAYVGCARGPEPTPVGTLANEETRKLRGRLRDALKAQYPKLNQFPNLERTAKRRILDALMQKVNRMQADELRTELLNFIPAQNDYAEKEN